MRTIGLIVTICFLACQKKEIQFGTTPEETYTHLLMVDTVTPQMSTVILDSFATNGQASLLLGRCQDPYMGMVSAKFFSQLGVPTDLDLPAICHYDSLVLIIPLTNYYYGDTALFQTIEVRELASNIDYTYGGKLYNTSYISEKQGIIGSKTVIVSPNKTDSLTIRLNDAKGLELFQKIRNRSDTVTSSDAFVKFFKGISISFSNDDSTGIFGVKATGDLKMRLHYHSTIPFYEKAYKDFTLIENGLRFNQLMADRSGMLIPSATNAIQEISSSVSNHLSFSQGSLGVLAKVIFPSLRNLLQINKYITLLKAELIIKPVDQSFNFKFKLPATLYLAQTNATNYMGNTVAQASSEYEGPFGSSPYYRFNVTSFVKELLQTPGLSDYGFFIIENAPGNTAQINRMIIGDAAHSQYRSQLSLTFLTVDE